MRPGLLGAELLLPVRSGGHVFSACRGTQCAAHLSGCQKGEEDGQMAGVPLQAGCAAVWPLANHADTMSEC